MIFLSIGLYFLFGYLKGKLEIKLDKTNFYFGDKIEGSLKFQAKKPIESNRLFILLVEEEYRTSGKSGRWKEISRVCEKTLEGKMKYPNNFSNVYSFNINIPLRDKSKIKVSKSFFSYATPFGSNIWRWRIIARLDAQGVDLETSKIIDVNENPNTQNLNPSMFIP